MRHWEIASGVLVVLVLATAGVSVSAQQRDGKSGKSPTSRESRDYQIPAGTMLSIELRTALSSDVSEPLQPIRGVLSSPVSVDGVELVPAGAEILGTVTDAVPALKKTDRARLSLRFNLLEHPQTGSRVPIRTEVRVFEVEGLRKGEKKKPGEGSAAFNQVRLEQGSALSASLREAFVVRIPDAR